jgi:hypothetical protein
MQRWQLSHFGLEQEFKKLAHGLELSMSSSFKIGRHFLKKGWRSSMALMWFFIESPRLWEKIGPDKKREISRSQRFNEIRSFIHPPNQHF